MPESKPDNSARCRYEAIGEILSEIARITQLKNCHGEYVFNRQNAESYIRKWYAKTSMCQAVTQRDRIQTAWTRYDYAIIKADMEISDHVDEFVNPEELV